MDQYILDMQAKYKAEAKKADQRLRRLEEKAKKTKSNDYLRYAYSRAQRDIKSHGGNKRFDINPPSDPDELQAMLSDVKRFNESVTSTITGFKKVNVSRVEKFNKALGTNFTVDEFTQIMETGAFDILTESGAALFGYRTAVRILSVLVKNKKNILNRQRRMTGKSMIGLLMKYKFKDDPDLYDIVQGKLK